MTESILMLRGRGNVDVQIGGPGNNWKYLSACASMTGPTVPFGATEIRWCQDPARADGFKISSQFRTAPDQISFDLMTKLAKIDFLDGLDCPFGQRARYAQCDEREDPNNYDPLMLTYSPVMMQEKSYEDLVVTDPANQDEILITAPQLALYEYTIRQIDGARIGTLAQLGDQAINDIEYCGAPQCSGYCGLRSDGCTNAWAVTDADVTPYANPNLIRMQKNWSTGVLTFTLAPILPLNNNAEGIECAGSRLIVSSNGDSMIVYNDENGDQDEWEAVVLANAPTASHNALFALNARIVFVGCANGTIYKSVDGGLTFEIVHTSGEITTEAINAIHFYNENLGYAVGDNGVILKTTNGGFTWQDMTEVTTTVANLLAVRVPPNRPKEVYIGTNDGQVFRSTDEGDTFALMAFAGDGVGTIDDLDFIGPHAGEVLFILQNDGGPRGRILRDLSGGAGGNDVEEVLNYTRLTAAGIDINAITPCSVNEVLFGGELLGGFPMMGVVS